MRSIRVTVPPERERTCLLVSNGERDLTVPPSPHSAYSRAALALLEGLAPCYQVPLSVALVADELEHSCAEMFLCDALGFGERTNHNEVALARRSECGRKRHPIEENTSFSDFRRDSLEVVR